MTINERDYLIALIDKLTKNIHCDANSKHNIRVIRNHDIDLLKEVIEELYKQS